MEVVFLIDNFINDMIDMINLIKYLKKAVEFLRGKKAYIVGILMIVLGLLTNNQQLILEGLGLITLRAGIAKIAK